MKAQSTLGYCPPLLSDGSTFSTTSSKMPPPTVCLPYCQPPAVSIRSAITMSNPCLSFHSFPLTPPFSSWKSGRDYPLREQNDTPASRGRAGSCLTAGPPAFSTPGPWPPLCSAGYLRLTEQYSNIRKNAVCPVWENWYSLYLLYQMIS